MKKTTSSKLLIILAILTLIICVYACKKETCGNIRMITKVKETDSIMMVQELGVKCDQERERLINYMEVHYDSLYNRTYIKYGEEY